MQIAGKSLSTGRTGSPAATVAALLVALAGGGLLLHRLAGPPAPPALPDAAAVGAALTSAEVPYGALVYGLGTACWLLWLWLAGALALRVLLHGAEAAARGAAWVAALRRLSDRVTPPVLRRVVDGALVATVVINVAGRATPAAAAPFSHLAAFTPAGAVPGLGDEEPPAPEADRHAIHTVRENDTLWRIAEAHYGNGAAFTRIVDANAGRRMPDGRTFTRGGVIHPGWQLRIPRAGTEGPPGGAPALDADGGGQHVVRPGETLGSIAAARLGDSGAWSTIFEVNRGAASLPDGRTLTHPDLIWPGLRLRLPERPAVPEHGGAGDSPVTEQGQAPAPDKSQNPPVPAAASDTATRTDGAAEIAGVSGEEPPAGSGQDVDGIAVRAHDSGADDSGADGAAPLDLAELGTGAGRGSGAGVTAPGTLGTAGLAAAGTLAVAGALAVRRVRRSLDEPPPGAGDGPQPPPVRLDAFAEAEPDRPLAHRLRGAEVDPVRTATAAALRFLASRCLARPALLGVAHGRGSTGAVLELRLDVPPTCVEEVLDLAPALGAHLGGAGRAEVTHDGDVLLMLSALRSVDFLSAGGGLDRGIAARDVRLLPVGARSPREVTHAGWDALGHVLVAGDGDAHAGGAATVLTALVAALAAQDDPSRLRLIRVGTGGPLPAALLRLPHWRTAPSPGDSAPPGLIDALRLELVRRRRAAAAAEGAEFDRPDVVLVVPELGAAAGDEDLVELLDTVAADGPGVGIRVLAATARPEAVPDRTLAQFTTRLVLRLRDAAQSARLLGAPGAVELDGGGDLLARIAGRSPERLRGFRVSAERLDEMARLLGVPQAAGAPEPVPPPAQASAQASAQARAEQGTARDGTPAAEPRLVTGEHTAPSGAAPEAERDDVEAQAAQAAQAAHEAHEEGEEDKNASTGGDAQAAVGTPGPVVDVRCFGAFEVRCNGRPLAAVGPRGEQHHRAWEVLAYLATRPSPVASSAKLVAAVWPEASEDSGPVALGQALRRLRLALGHQVPGLESAVARRDGRAGTTTLDGAHIRSDVHRFAALCEAARRLPPEDAIGALEEARALYRGDVLAGQSYTWMHELEDDVLTLPDRYRETYRQITADLAALYRRTGRPADAVPLYRGLLRAEPTVESVARELYRCYGELGDAVALQREHRHLTAALLAAYGSPTEPALVALCQPERETTAVYEQVLARLGGATGSARIDGTTGTTRVGRATPASAERGGREGQALTDSAGGRRATPAGGATALPRAA